ncbi:MAG: spore coat protein CotH, partial [Fibrobacter sp.]|nr:spore coat protein CotH [Fibrobacter sp.]
YNFIDLAFMAFEPVNGVASLDNIPTLVTRAGYHLRGQSSLMLFKQAPYRIEFWDNFDNDADYPVLGMPAGSDWALVSPCTDNSLIRNVFGFELGKSMGLTTVQYRFAEVFINQDGGALMKDDYEGVYTLIQSIKNKKNTLDLKKLKPDDTEPDKISGGYILKFEWAVNDTDMLLLECTGAPKISNSAGFSTKPVDPSATCFDGLELSDPNNPNPQQIAWITRYVQDFHDALHTKTMDEWQKYIDVNSVVGMHLLNEISCDVDAWRRSHYFYKDRGKALKAGPVWDYNFAFGNFTSTTSGWHCDKQTIASNDWHKMMWKQQDFRHLLKLRYSELRKTVLSDENVDKIIQNIIDPIKNIGQRNFEAWPMGKCSSMSSGGQWGGGSTFKGDTTWSGQVDSLKIWTKKRLKNLDSCVTTLP